MKKNNVALNIGKLLILPVGVYLLFFVLCQIFDTPVAFGVGANFKTILLSMCPTVILAWGASYNLRSFRFDFSLGAMQILAVVIGTCIGQIVYHAAPDGYAGSIVLMLASTVVGIILGLIVGAIYVVTKVAPIIIGLAMALIYEGIAVWLIGGVLPYIGDYGSGASIANDVQHLGLFGTSPWIFIVTAVVFVIFFLYNRYSVFSFQINALSRTPKVGVKMGINEVKNVLMCYAIGGFGAGLSGAIKLMVETNRVPQLGLLTINTLTGALGPVFIGMFLAKYAEITTSTLLAAFTYACLNTGLVNLNLPSYMQNIVTIAFLMVFLGISMNTERRGIRKALRKRGVFVREKLAKIQAGETAE